MSRNAANPRPIWSAKCEAQKILKKMVAGNKMDLSLTATELQKLHPEFMKFSTDVFRVHLRKVAGKTGEHLKTKFTPDCEDDSQSSTSNDMNKRLKMGGDEDEEEGSYSLYETMVKYRNPPVQMSVYKDSKTGQKKVTLVISLFSGVQSATFRLIGDGPGTREAVVDYFWAKTSVDHERIFAKEIEHKVMPSCHPKIEQLRNDLELYREKIEDIPKGSIELILPIPVQTVAGSVSIDGKIIEDDRNATYLVVELTGYQTAYSVKEKDMKATFYTA